MRAVVLPALVDIPKDVDAHRATELDRDLIPVPKAAASVILPPPETLELELAEVRPSEARAASRDIEPPPPPLFDDKHEPPALPLEVTAPELIAPAPAPETATKPTHAEVESAPAPVEAAPVEAAPVEAAPVEATPVAAAPEIAIQLAPTEATPANADLFAQPRTSRRFGWWLAVAWVTTAAIPAVVVWLVMRTPNHSVPKSTAEPPAQVQAPAQAEPPAQEKPPTEPATNAPTAPSTTPGNTDSGNAVPGNTDSGNADSGNAVPGNAVPSSAEAATSASPAPTVPVLVQTDASDRVDVLIKSKPTGARIYRLGKEIARTPVTIQIGRGERRVFEIGSPSMGTKRVSVDGQKSEILVTLVGEASPPTVNLPAPLPSNKYDRLR